MENQNPKSLKLDVLSSTSSKVTLGFKCNPQTKLNLALEAQSLNLSLSEYVESIVYEHGLKNKEVKTLKEKIAFYENDFLKDLFETHKSEVVEFYNHKDEKVKIEIKSIQDLYTVITQSFK